MRVFRGLFCLILLIGVSDAHAASSCVEQVAKLTKTLKGVPNYTQLVPPQMPVNLPHGKSAGLIKRVGPVVDVKDGRYGFQNKQSGLDALEPLEVAFESVKRAEALTGVPQSPVYLRLDAREEVQDILPLMCKLASMRELWLLVNDPGYPAPKVHTVSEPPEQLKAVLSQVDGLKSAVEKASAFGELLQQATGSCAALTKAFSGLNQVPVAQRAQTMKQRAASGLTGCKCQGADVPVIEHLLERIVAPTQPPAYAAQLKLKCGGEGRAIRLPNGARVQALADALKTGNGLVHIVIAP